MSDSTPTWPLLPACCLARSARELSLLVGRLEQEALSAGKCVVMLRGTSSSITSGDLAGSIHPLSYADFQTLTQAEILALFRPGPPGDGVILAEAPSLEQDHHLHALATATGIRPVCIYRLDQIAATRLLEVIAEHQHIFTVDGWVNQLSAEAHEVVEIPEFLNGPARFRLVTNSIPFLLAYLDRDLVYRFINEPFCRWFGLPRSAILGRTMRELIGSHAFEIARPHIQIALEGHKTSLVNRIHHVDGTIHTARFTYIPDLQTDGRVRGFISSIDDITHQVQVEDQLRQSEYRLRTIISNIPIVLFTLDQDGIFTLSEGKGLQILGFEPGQVVGRSVFEVYRGNEKLLECVRKALAGESFQELVTDMQEHIFDTWYSPLRDSEGGIQGVLGISADITERMQIETALKNSEERYRTLVENQGEGVLIVDADLRIEYLNLAAEGVLKRPTGELIGSKLDEFFKGAERAVLHNQFEARKKGERSSYELRYAAPSGEEIHLLITATPRFDSSGVFLGSFAVIRDITERKMVEEDLRYRSTHDALTGAHNRFFFDEELSRLEDNHRQPISVLMIDMDGLKAINDTHGHFAGDEVLRRVAFLVRSCLRGEDLVARFGGDEFAVLLPNTRSAEMERIIVRMQRAMKISNQRHTLLPLSISIGGATAMPGQSLRRALEEADQRLYEQKRRKYNSAGPSDEPGA